MKQTDVVQQLNHIKDSQDFLELASELALGWSERDDALETVEPILRFMEENPELDFGTPGPLVHFVEQFYRRGYESKLIDSLERRPIKHTVWMLNRIINGAHIQAERDRLMLALAAVIKHLSIDSGARELATQFLERHSRL